MDTNMFLRFASRVRIRTILTILVLVVMAAGITIALAQDKPVRLADTPGAVHTFGDEDRGISVNGIFAPLGQGFGDRVIAKVIIWVDATLIDPDTVTFEAIDFEPYTTVTDLYRETEQLQDVVLITYSVELRCLEVGCLDAEGSPVLPKIDRMYVRYELWESYEDGSPRLGYKGGGWRASAIVGRITTEDLESYVFDGDTTPPNPQLGVSPRVQQLFLIVGAFLIAGSILLFINPRVNLWPKREDSNEWIARYKRENALSDEDHLRETLEKLKRHTERSDRVLYRLRDDLNNVGLKNLAIRVQIADFGPDSDSAVFDSLIRDITRELDSGGINHG